MKKLLLLAIMTFSLSSFGNDARDIYETGSLVLSEIEKQERGLKNFVASNDEYDWYLNTIQVLVQVSVAVEIPWIATAKLQPEVELYWKR